MTVKKQSGFHFLPHLMYSKFLEFHSLRSSRFRFLQAKRGKHERRARALGKTKLFLLLFAQCPRASFVLTPLGLKETETTATQAKIFRNFRTTMPGSFKRSCAVILYESILTTNDPNTEYTEAIMA